MIGVALPLLPNPVFRELTAFRERMGYQGPLVALREKTAEYPARRIPFEQRLAELQTLLAAPDLPRPTDTFAAYSLLVHLALAVDNKSLGPLGLPGPLRDRPICQPPEFFTSARSPGGVVGVLPEFAFLLDGEGGIEVAQRSPGGPVPLEIAEDDRFAPLKQYAWRDVRPFPLSAVPSKLERLRQYFAFLESAPAPEDRLQCHALATWLFGALEGRHRALPGASASGYMFTTPPMFLYQTASCPDADIVLSLQHAMLYYPDGTMELYARDAGRDVRDAGRTVSIVLTARDCRVRSRSREIPHSGAGQPTARPRSVRF